MVPNDSDIIRDALTAAAVHARASSVQTERAIIRAAMAVRQAMANFTGRVNGGWTYEEEARFLLAQDYTPISLLQFYAVLDGSPLPRLKKLREILRGDNPAQPLPLWASFPDYEIEETSLPFVPPEGVVALVAGDGSYKPPEFRARTKALLDWLTHENTLIQGRRLTRDDIKLFDGQPPHNSLQERLYIIVRLKPLNVDIAVCDQVGNAMFVANPALDPADWAALGKKSLQEFQLAVRIVMGKDWQVGLFEVLNTVNAYPVPELVMPVPRRANSEKIQAVTSDAIWLAMLAHLVVDASKFVGAYSGHILTLPGLKWHGVSHALAKGIISSTATTIAQLRKEMFRGAADAFQKKYGRLPNEQDDIRIDPRSLATWAMAAQAAHNNRKITFPELVGINYSLTEKTVFLAMLNELATSQPKQFISQHTGPIEYLYNLQGDIINMWLDKGHDGLPGGSSLSKLRDDNLKKCAKEFKEIYGRLPRKGDHILIHPDSTATWAMAVDAAEQNNKINFERIVSEENILTADMIFLAMLDELVASGRFVGHKTNPVPSLFNMTWNAIDLALQKGRHNLPNGSSLAKLREKKLREYAGNFEKIFQRQPTEDDDIAITSSSSATWHMAGSAVRHPPFAISLEEILSGEVRQLTVDIIWSDILDHLKEHETWVEVETGPVKAGNGYTWKNRDRFLRDKRRGITESSSLMGIKRQKLNAALTEFWNDHGRLPDFKLDQNRLFDVKKEIYWPTVLGACFFASQGSSLSMFYKIFRAFAPAFCVDKCKRPSPTQP